MRDAEFIAGRLDTGFIARFNERHAQHAGEEPETDPTARDLAIIAAALAHTARVQDPTHNGANVQTPVSQWRSAGRSAQQRGRVL